MGKGAPICPNCGSRAFMTETRYGMRASCCGLWSWDYKPLVDRRTHEARKAAHEAFDRLWKVEGWSRSYCYQLLSTIMNMRPDDCHMSRMSADNAERVPAAVREIRRRLESDPDSVQRRHSRLTKAQRRENRRNYPPCDTSSSSSSSALSEAPSSELLARSRRLFSLDREETSA